MVHWSDIRREFRPMMQLAVPLALAELGWMVAGIIDILMAGPLGAAAVGAGSLAGMLFFPIAIAGTGLLLGMDTLVAQAFGARDLADCRRTLINGVWLAAALSPFLALALWAMLPLLHLIGTNERVMEQLAPFLRALLWGIPPLMIYAAVRRYLQAMNLVKPVTFALISANLVNAAGNWALMYGHLGFRPMGLEGSGWSTSISRVYMAVVLVGAVYWHDRRSGGLLWRVTWRPDFARIRKLIDLGMPSAGQILFEGAVFGIVSVLASRLDEASLAAHGIAVNVIATTYMVPLGISTAAAVRVGQAVGCKDTRGAAAAGWTALFISAVFMGGAGVLLWVAPRWLLRLYIRDTSVVAIGAVLLRIAAVFELFDGLQVTATGALRGLGDTRTPMLAHFVGYWVVGLPVVYVLCFPMQWGAAGIWVGLSAALILIGLVLVVVWRKAIGELLR